MSHENSDYKPFTVRLSPQLAEQIETARRFHHRSANAEIVFRLEQSFKNTLGQVQKDNNNTEE